MKPGKASGAEAPRSGPPTLADVARKAGVSTATISRMLNSPQKVSSRTAERINAVLDELGYVPNRLAGGLASNRTRVIAAILPTMSLAMFDEIFRTVAAELAGQRYHVLLQLGGVYEAEVNQTIRDVIAHRPDGLILVGGIVDPVTTAQLRKMRLPTLQLWDLPADPVDMAVGFPAEEIGAKIAGYLIEKGYRRPFLVSNRGPQSLARRYGFAREYVLRGLPEPPHRELPFPTTFSEGRRILADLLQDGETPDVIVCSSDWAAHGIMEEARSRGLRMPDDIAVFGFGDLDFAADLSPPLSTVRVDRVKLGRLAAELMLRRAAGDDPAHAVIDIGAELVIRQSA